MHHRKSLLTIQFRYRFNSRLTELQLADGCRDWSANFRPWHPWCPPTTLLPPKVSVSKEQQKPPKVYPYSIDYEISW